MRPSPPITGNGEWSSREDRDRAERLDRCLDGPLGPERLEALLGGAADTGPATPASDDLAAALSGATALRRLAARCPEAPEDGLVALRAALAARQAEIRNRPWRRLPATGRAVLAAVAAVAVVLAGVAVGSVVTRPPVVEIGGAVPVSVTTALQDAGVQLNEAHKALARGDLGQARLLLREAQVSTSKAASKLPRRAALPPAPSATSSNLAAQLAAADSQVAALLAEVAQMQTGSASGGSQPGSAGSAAASGPQVSASSSSSAGVLSATTAPLPSTTTTTAAPTTTTAPPPSTTTTTAAPTTTTTTTAAPTTTTAPPPSTTTTTAAPTTTTTAPPATTTTTQRPASTTTTSAKKAPAASAGSTTVTARAPGSPRHAGSPVGG